MRPRTLAAALAAAGLLAALAPAAPGAPDSAQPKFAALYGANEVPTPGSKAGRGSATLIVPGNGTVCYAILVKGIDTPLAAHLHRGKAGVAGPVVVTLTPPPEGFASAVAGCVRAPAAVLRGIRNNPAGFYVNVHTARFPEGALRGQLFAAK
jgi:hypothetical protein